MTESAPASQGEATIRAASVALALVILLAGQIALYSVAGSAGWALPLSAGAALGLIWGLFGRMPPRLIEAAVRLRLSPRAILIALSATLGLLAALTTAQFEQLDRRDYAPVFILWGGSILAYLAAFAPPRAIDWRVWWRAHRREVAAIAALTAVAAALRFFQLGAVPRVINGDEGLIGQFAVTATQGQLVNPFALFENIGGLYMQLINLCLRLFGQTPFALRLLPAIGGTLAVPAVYLLARHLFGRRVGFIAAALLAVSHAHLHFSRTVAVSYIHATWLVPLELYFFIAGLQRRSAWRLAVSAAIIAVHFSVYLSAQIVVPLLLIYLVIAAAIARPIDPTRPSRRAFWRDELSSAGIWGAGLVVMALPQISYALRHPDQFLSRLNSGGTFQSGWLADEVARTGLADWQVLLDRIAHAFLSLTHYPAQDFYGASIPLLTTLVGALFMLGLMLALWRTRDHRYLLLNGYFWGFTVAIAVFSIPPSADSYRMLAALPAALIMAAVALAALTRWLEAMIPQRRLIPLVTAGAVLLTVSYVNVSAYYLDFAARCRYGAQNTRFASYLGHYLNGLGRGTDAYLLSTDYLRYGTHLSVDFLSGGVPVQNVTGPAAELVTPADAAVIAPAERADELRDWARAHPGGELHAEYDCNQLMLLAYHLP